MLLKIYNTDLTLLRRDEIADLLENIIAQPSDNTYVLNLLVNKFARINGVWTADEQGKIKEYCNKYHTTSSGFQNPEVGYIFNTLKL